MRLAVLLAALAALARGRLRDQRQSAGARARNAGGRGPSRALSDAASPVAGLAGAVSARRVSPG